MTEEPSGPDPDDERMDKSGDGEPSHRDESDTERDPFDETFIVKETRETHSSRETDSPQDADSSWDTDQQDDEWGRIPIGLDDGDEDAVSDSDGDGEAPEDDEMVPEPSSTPIVSGEPTLEGVVFVVLGAVAMVLVMFRLGSVMLG